MKARKNLSKIFLSERFKQSIEWTWNFWHKAKINLILSVAKLDYPRGVVKLLKRKLSWAQALMLLKENKNEKSINSIISSSFLKLFLFHRRAFEYRCVPSDFLFLFLDSRKSLLTWRRKYFFCTNKIRKKIVQKNENMTGRWRHQPFVLNWIHTLHGTQ